MRLEASIEADSSVSAVAPTSAKPNPTTTTSTEIAVRRRRLGRRGGGRENKKKGPGDGLTDFPHRLVRDGHAGLTPGVQEAAVGGGGGGGGGFASRRWPRIILSSLNYLERRKRSLAPVLQTPILQLTCPDHGERSGIFARVRFGNLVVWSFTVFSKRQLKDVCWRTGARLPFLLSRSETINCSDGRPLSGQSATQPHRDRGASRNPGVSPIATDCGGQSVPGPLFLLSPPSSSL